MITLALMLAALAAGVPHVDPGQRSQPVRVDRGGLLQVEPAYFNLAAQTGGDFYFWAPGEFARAALKLPIHDEPVLLAYGRFDAPRRGFEIPVESGVRTLTIFAGAQRKDRAVLVRPGGGVVLGRCVIPNQPLRVVVTGRDRLGVAFRRMTSALQTPL